MEPVLGGCATLAGLTTPDHKPYLLFVMTYGPEHDEGWTTLADRTRRSLLMELAAGERTVGELTQALPVSQPAVSQHLKVLKHVGLVSDRAEGTKRIYRLNEDGVAALRDQLDTFWKRTMSGFEQLMEEDQ
jgi:DNA-binding transcriptional ArsR family regulator